MKTTMLEKLYMVFGKSFVDENLDLIKSTTHEIYKAHKILDKGQMLKPGQKTPHELSNNLMQKAQEFYSNRSS